MSTPIAPPPLPNSASPSAAAEPHLVTGIRAVTRLRLYLWAANAGLLICGIAIWVLLAFNEVTAGIPIAHRPVPLLTAFGTMFLFLVLIYAVTLIVLHAPDAPDLDPLASSGAPLRDPELITHKLLSFVAQALPTVLFIVAYPIAALRLGQRISSGDSTLLILLAVCVTMPWLTSAASFPLYTHLRSLPHATARERREYGDEFCRIWPIHLAWSTLLIAIFTLVTSVIMDLSWVHAGFYALGLFANTLFTQALIPAQERGRLAAVCGSLVVYALLIVAVPQWWWLAPLVGCVPLLVSLRTSMRWVRFPSRVEASSILSAMIAGLVTGSILWADKYLLVAVYGVVTEAFIYMVYAALIPMIVGFALFWSNQRHVISLAVEGVGKLLPVAPASRLKSITTAMYRRVDQSIAQTLLTTSLGTIGVLLVSPALGFTYSWALLMVVLVPTALLGLMVYHHNLGEEGALTVQRCVGVVHVAGMCSVFFWTPAVAYGIIIVVDAVLMVISAWVGRRRFIDAPYELYWKTAGRN